MRRQAPRAASAVLGAVALIALVACGGDGDATPSTTVAAVVTTVAPTTTHAPAATAPPTTKAPATTAAATTTEVPATTTTVAVTTTEAPTTTAEPTTTAAPTTTEPPVPQTIATTTPLPQPITPPPPRAIEEYIELGTIEMPSIGIVKPLLEGISLNTLDKGPGHWPGTAMPGQQGNVVVAGHRTSKDRPFRHIDQLVEGDEVIFTTDAGRFVYIVTGTQIVLPDAMWIVGQTPASTATLFACHPVGSTRERIVVFLQLQA